jgi:monoamine oxidase
VGRGKIFFKLQQAMKECRRSEDQTALHSRRDFIKVSAAAAVTAAVGRPLFAAPLALEPVLILGAGGAGLAAGHRLQRAGIPIRIFEASSRIGGRIMTQRNFGAEGQFIERGGEYIDTSHKTLIALAHQMGVQLQRCDGGDKGLDATLFIYQGQTYTDADLVAGLKPLLAKIDRAIAGGARELYYDDKPSAHALRWDRMTLQEFLDATSGSVAPWIREIVRVAYVAEYGREASEQSALNLIILMSEKSSAEDGLFGKSDEVYRVLGGNSGLTEALANEISRRAPTAIELDTKVIALARRGRHIVVTVEQNGRTYEHRAHHVICALPFTVLRQVDGLQHLGLSKVKLACIQNLAYGTNSKTMLEFTTKFWLQAGALPASTGTIYNDLASQCLWETSKMQAGSHGILTCFQGGYAGAAANDQLASTLILPELERLYPGVGQLFVKSTAQNWSQVPTAGGSYACMLAGQWSQINGAQGTPELNGRLLFAGEHASDEFQGYMNGAYETGIQAAEKIIKGIASPAGVA